jgi:hypothetical protein
MSRIEQTPKAPRGYKKVSLRGQLTLSRAGPSGITIRPFLLRVTVIWTDPGPTFREADLQGLS